MTGLYFVLGTLSLIALLIWLLVRQAEKQGRTETISEAEVRAIEDAVKAAKLRAAIQHRDPEENRKELADKWAKH